MPLKKGSGQKTILTNIRELMNSYEEDGKIGNIRPRNKAHASKIAQAAAYSKAKEGRSNPIRQGSSTANMGKTPGGACPKGMPFLK